MLEWNSHAHLSDMALSEEEIEEMVKLHASGYTDDEIVEMIATGTTLPNVVDSSKH